MSSMITADTLRRCTLHQLPVELVVHIMKASPSLSALWSFINTSARLATIFDGCALEVTENVLRCTVPEQTQVLLYAVFQLRLSLHPPSLHAARELREVNLSSLQDRLLATPITTSEIPRSFVFLAHKIHVLAHECIEHYIRVCMTMNPSCLDDPTFKGYWYLKLRQPKGRLYQPKDSGPPSWAEEQLVLLNMWRLQYYFDMKAACDVGQLGWSTADQEELKSLDLPEFYHMSPAGSGHYITEQLMTVYAYVHGVRTPEQDATLPLRLPSPNTRSRFDLGCFPEPKRNQPDGKALIIDFRPDSWIFAWMMSRNLKTSPLCGFGPQHFRRFGFTLWEDSRMTDLGLLPPRSHFFSYEYYFKWRSILSDEECDPANRDNW
ncbi:hypothetical protein F5B22DRAFT_622257 [Xylaria bambusicola]|uniref:uncharacterized protein n=1 Tax=Xylaria bambusicola TaxID=326684 RepID=UPI002008B79A|nr:uncharacterized protein F5B22DRAFT_622257 [Xylaria bambusicola]KAI0506842.1 hypothetical protein F5B22DRAFT_622257 [Xylaria bambusicola]